MPERPSQTNCKVLLVDDDRDQRLLTWDTICMNETECCVRDAATAEEALTLLRGENGEPPYEPDVMYIDIEMPGMGGLDLLQFIRRSASWAHMKVFVVSGSTDEAGCRQALACGADGFINKSHDVMQMMDDIRKTFRCWPGGKADELTGSGHRGAS